MNDNIDTDQILPATLKLIDKKVLGIPAACLALFYTNMPRIQIYLWIKPEYRKTILRLTFREHAALGFIDYGFKVVIAALSEISITIMSSIMACCRLSNH